jgi:glycosyltransferase involved in cell wall biosynthesis
MNPAPRLGLVINTYNQPEYLDRVLRAVSGQTILPQEVFLADDGSTAATRAVFSQWAAAQSFTCEHVWQEHKGFRRSRVLNHAIARAQSEYLAFLDGDTVPHPRFLEDHKRLAEPFFFIQGHRALVEQKSAAVFGLNDFCADRRTALWAGQLKGIKHAYRWVRPLKRIRQDLPGVRGCNLGIWRKDLVAINGYNEAFVGWGREDSELALRLINSGVRRLDVRGWALCYHLWHPPVSRENLSLNDQLLEAAFNAVAKRCEKGLDQHLGVQRAP